MNPGDLLAVYGSLRQGGAADLSKKDGAEYVGEDHIKGDLYAVSWFPGFKFGSGEHTVKVEVYRLLTQDRIRQLDGYEGYPRLFDREVVTTDEGRRVWVYIYNGDVEEDRRVESGDWMSRKWERV